LYFALAWTGRQVLFNFKKTASKEKSLFSVKIIVLVKYLLGKMFVLLRKFIIPVLVLEGFQNYYLSSFSQRIISSVESF